VVSAHRGVSHETVMHKASLVLTAEADFRLISPAASMIKSPVPLVSECAVPLGVGYELRRPPRPTSRMMP
jgi:predicted GTPase